jgi:hypothetical protein
MRTYPRNSPDAAARLVALVLIADGHVCRTELETLERLDIEREIGLTPQAMLRGLHTLCEDLLASSHAGGTMLADIDDAMLASLMAEVDDPRLQHAVLKLACAAAQADGHLADGEAMVLDAARRHWHIDLSAGTDAAARNALQPA